MVNIAQLKIAKPPDELCALGLGSCVGVVLYDPVSKVSGMLHVLLPAEQEVEGGGHGLQTKFADPGVRLLLEEVVKAGAQRKRIHAKLAGGAAVLTPVDVPEKPVGRRNGEACIRMLKAMNIPVDGMDLGGTSGRSVYFEPETQIMRVKKLVGGERQL
jgi:chemotaxis protein CheD